MTAKTFAFIHANIIPMDEEHVLFDQTIIVQNGRITEIGPSASTDILGGAIQIDATGQYLIPALADMHIHLEGPAWNIMFPPDAQFSAEDLDFEEILSPYIANGITTVQVMSALPEHIALRDQINREEIIGPRLILNRMIDGPGQSWPSPINTQVSTPEEARQVVYESKEASYDGLKVYTFLDQACYDAILAAAEEVGMPVTGHIPNALSVEHILGSGQRLIAHAEEVVRQARGDFSSENIDYLADLIADSNTWITPTLTTTRKIMAIFDNLDEELSRPEMDILHPMVGGIWAYLIENMYLQIPPEHQQTIRNGFKNFQRPFTKSLHDKGSKLMAGTDAFIPTNLPGFSIHDELLELVAVGLTPYEALKTSTTHPLEYLGELDDSGTVEIGNRANMVLLGGNPLEDIKNTRAIRGVFYNNKWLKRDDLQRNMETLEANF